MKSILTTAEFDARLRFNRWKEAVLDRIVPIEIERLDDAPFEGVVEAAEIGGVAITRLSQGALRTKLTPQTIRRHDKGDMLAITMPLRGSVRSAQDERSAVNRVGEFVVLDRRLSVMETSPDSQLLVLEIPRTKFENVVGSSKLYTSLTIGGTAHGGTLINMFFTELIRVHHQMTPEMATRMANIGIDLLISGVADRLAREVNTSINGNLIVQRAKAYVEAHLSDPTLDATTLAAAVGVSLRYLQVLFQEREQYISDWIWRRRLAHAALRLEDPGQQHISIGNIAMDSGFSSQSHFSRRFRDSYGLTATEYRIHSIQSKLAHSHRL